MNNLYVNILIEQKILINFSNILVLYFNGMCCRIMSTHTYMLTVTFSLHKTLLCLPQRKQICCSSMFI